MRVYSQISRARRARVMVPVFGRLHLLLLLLSFVVASCVVTACRDACVIGQPPELARRFLKMTNARQLHARAANPFRSHSLPAFLSRVGLTVTDSFLVDHLSVSRSFGSLPPSPPPPPFPLPPPLSVSMCDLRVSVGPCLCASYVLAFAALRALSWECLSLCIHSHASPQASLR